MIHRIQVRRPLRQPQEFHIPAVRKGLRGLRRMAGIFVQDHNYMPTAIVPANDVQELLKIRRTMPQHRPQQSVSRLDVEDTEKHALAFRPLIGTVAG